MAIYGYTKNYKLIKPQYDTDTWHDYEYDNLDTIDAVLSAIYASGNWKGFWKSNTHYNVGDIVIDRDTDTMYKVMVEHTTSAGSFAAEQTAHPDYYELWSPNNLAESWATKTDDKVSNEDYSAKAYAISSGLIDDGSAKEWAIGSRAIGNTNEYSAKKYATDAHNDYISMTTNPNVAAVGSSINNVNAVGQSISSVNTVAGNVASVNTVAGVSTDVTAVAGIASSVSTVASNDANITTVANNISDINTAASNMAAIKAAPTAATNAANSATDSANSATSASASAQQAAISAAGTHFKLFQHQWFDYELNDMAWLRADTFSWQDGTVYANAYNHLVDDIDGITPTTETVGGQTVTFYRASDGHKIVLANQETTVNNIYTATGVAWYYILDTVNNRFKLPRTKYDFNGLRGNVGDYIPESLPNITSTLSEGIPCAGNGQTVSGAFTTETKNDTISGVAATNNTWIKGFDASRSSSTYQDGAPVQQRGTQQYLYFYVGQYTQSAIEQTAGLNSELFNKKIDIDGNNVITAGANKILNTSSYTTNRILEIPQDIKLELNNGTLTLKAGSKVYVPNGFEADGTTPKFDVVNVQSDVFLQSYNGTYTECVVLQSGTLLDSSNISKCFSGNSAPSFTGSGIWYDTANNICKRSADGGATWETCSFPLCLCNVVSALRTSIDQVFNGFGYIGSTVFALPGVKVQIPNGRNEDGTFKSFIKTTPRVSTVTWDGVSFVYNIINENGLIDGFGVDWHFDYEKNILLNQNGMVRLGCIIFTHNHTPRVENFEPYSVDSLANSNASNFSQAGRSYLSGLGMPSDRYIDLTLGASGSTYTAPANGWFALSTWTTSTTPAYYQLFNITSNLALLIVPDQGNSYQQKGFIPCKSGDVVALIYMNIDAARTTWRFFYAQGEQ